MKTFLRNISINLIGYVLLSVCGNPSVAQDADLSKHMSGNEPVYPPGVIEASRKEDAVKPALDNGGLLSKTIQMHQREAHDPLVKETEIMQDDRVIFGKDEVISNGDWVSGDPLILNGTVGNGTSERFKLIDLKRGEDGNLYCAVVRRGQVTDNFATRVDTYRSNDGGSTWIFCGWFGYISGVIGNISLLVESRTDAVPDSTRLIVLYTYGSQTNHNDASVRMVTFRRDGSGPFSGTVALPSSQYQFCDISAVSDGAFYQGATYFGFVVSERRNDFTGVRRLKFFRTSNWGLNWSSVEYITGFSELNPSAQFLPGSTNELMIATDRHLGANDRRIAIIRSTWSVSSTFQASVPAPSGNYYLQPCLTVKQNNPADSIMLTCTKNGSAVYFYSTNRGTSWVYDATLSSPSNGSNKNYTWCSSSTSGDDPFTALYMSDDGDSIVTRRGKIGNMGFHNHKVNSNNSYTLVSPVCAVWQNAGRNLSAVAYSGYSGENAFIDQEGNRDFRIQLLIQGLFDVDNDMLTRADTVTIILKPASAPYHTLDSVVTVLDTSALSVYGRFKSLTNGASGLPLKYHIVIRHRNSLETWSSLFTSPSTDSVIIDLSNQRSKAIGNNLAIMNLFPPRCAIYSGDVNQDGTIDGSDLAMIDNDAYSFSTGYINTDLDGNDFTDASDMALADNNASQFISVILP